MSSQYTQFGFTLSLQAPRDIDAVVRICEQARATTDDTGVAYDMVACDVTEPGDSVFIYADDGNTGAAIHLCKLLAAEFGLSGQLAFSYAWFSDRIVGNESQGGGIIVIDLPSGDVVDSVDTLSLMKIRGFA